MKKLAIGLLTASLVMLADLGAQAIEVGQSVPLFRAGSTQGPVHLGDLLGKKHLVLALYYADFTPV
jgi:thioredoxin-dependent peroxiredoxin